MNKEIESNNANKNARPPSSLSKYDDAILSKETLNLNVLREMINCVKTGVVYDLETGEWYLDAHPIIVTGSHNRSPIFYHGSVEKAIPLDTDEDRKVVLKILQRLEKGTILRMRTKTTQYMKLNSSAEIHFSMNPHNLKRRFFQYNGDTRESSYVDLDTEHLSDVMEVIMSLEVMDEDWHLLDEGSNFSCGARGGTHWMLLPTGRQGRFALSVHDDHLTYMQTMVINIEDVPRIILAYNRDISKITEITLNEKWKGHRYSWAIPEAEPKVEPTVPAKQDKEKTKADLDHLAGAILSAVAKLSEND